MSQDTVAQRHALEMQALAICCGAAYGALALGGLMAIHLVLGGAFADLGALLACGAAFAAYGNFTVVASAPQSPWVGRLLGLAVLLGVCSALVIVAGLV